ncbi:MAG: hypothetical protein HY901_26165 [Deltaproteobacteria bacterium]|nr:hypothetical protein [Deltaproteobacteria bacterium]
MGKTAMVIAATLAATLAGAEALAQVPGDPVRLETPGGVVEGVLVDRLPNGYLVNKGKASEVVPYTRVRSITKRAPAPADTPAPVSGSAAVVPAAVAMPAPVPAPMATPEVVLPGLASDPAPIAGPIPPGVEPPAPPPPPEPPAPVAAPSSVPVQAMPAAPAPVSAPAPELKRRSRALMGVGIGLFGVGVLTASAGALTFLNGQSQPSQTCEYSASSTRCYPNQDRVEQIGTGTAMIGAGMIAAAVGIPLWIVGGAKVPAGRTVHAEAPAPLVPTWAFGPGSAQLTLRFP